MRPLQRKLAQRIIQDVAAKNPPVSLADATARYFSHLGPARYFDTGQGWHGEIRDAALVCLFKNGFVKAGAVKCENKADQLSDWVDDPDELMEAANLEITFGGNTRLLEVRRASSKDVKVLGQGLGCVYVYTDSLLSELNYSCCKIGRHNSAEKSAVLGRIFSQYGTGNPGVPELRYIFRTRDPARLEAELHKCFDNVRITGVAGTEWFRCGFSEVERKWAKLRPEHAQ